MLLQKECKICSFFGHRNVVLVNGQIDKLTNLIEDLIVNKNVKIFLFGSKSSFNESCHRIVTDLKKKYQDIERYAYTCKSESCIIEEEREYWERIFRNIKKEKIELLGVEAEIEHKTKFSSGKAGYVERNFAMIDKSDYCIFYYDEIYKPQRRKYSKHCIAYYQPKSGTSIAYKYAIQKKKEVINIFNE